MNRLSKAILIGLGGLLAVGVVALLALNLYVQSADAQERIRARLSEALGMPLQLTRVSVTPWGGLRLSGITIPSDEEGAPPFLEAPAFTAKAPLLSILRGRVVIDEITIQSPRISWAQTESGEWRLPTFPEPEQPAIAIPDAAEAPHPPQPGEPAPPARPTAKKPRDDAETEIRIGLIAVRKGELEFLDHERQPVVRLTEVDLASSLPARDRAEGRLTAGQAAIKELLFLRDVSVPFTSDSAGFVVRGASASISGGDITAGYSIQPAQEDAPWSASGKFAEVDLSRLIQESGGSAEQASGQLSGVFEVDGRSGEEGSMGGKGRIELRDGRIQQYPLLKVLGETLRIEELQQLDLREASADFKIKKGVVKLDALLLRTANLQLTADGDIHPDGALDLDARLTINAKLSRSLPQFIEDNFKESDTEPGWRSLDFDVGGTLEKPGTNLVERMVGTKLEKEVTGFFENFFGGKKSKSGDKKKDKKKDQ